MLEDLEIYKLSLEISKCAWDIYNQFDWRIKKVSGDQFITAIDSVGANIAEGYGRFHFADRNKFNYNARGSLLEGLYWLKLLSDRDLVSGELSIKLRDKIKQLHVKLNGYIAATKKKARE